MDLETIVPKLWIAVLVELGLLGLFGVLQAVAYGFTGNWLDITVSAGQVLALYLAVFGPTLITATVVTIIEEQ